MYELTHAILEVAPIDLDSVFRAQLADGTRPVDAYASFAATRGRHGFRPIPRNMLTAPDENHKLEGSKVPAYGLTLQHFRSVLPAAPTRRRMSVNACPNAGHCTRVCVLDNGMGRYDSVQRGRLARTDLWVTDPVSATRILAFELQRAVRKHGSILFRPNVNSDVAWQRVLPSLFDGVTLPGVMSYGYSKRPETLANDGWLGATYRVAYSWNERSNADDVRAFLMRGGAVAVVTSRRKGAPVLSVFPFGTTAGAVDADTTDEWMLTRGMVVGDLSAKGKARSLIGRSRFVVNADAAA